ncbi:MAG TPA: hypothetical protein VGN80_15850 [Devosiaceae bacterium]|jgi:hypothetical protein|nr:hypothetical protein [Devosiaceae bacterium]
MPEETGMPNDNTRRWRLAAWGGAAALLLLPLAAMQVTDEVAWDLTDFVIIGALLLACALGFELALRRGRSGSYRAGAALAIAGAFLLVWVNAAVGIIGSEDNPANLLFALVLLTGIGGAALARLRPRGVAAALAAAAGVQVVVGAVALLGGLGREGANWPWAVLGLTAVFAGIWLGAAWLFRRAGQAAGR